MMTSMINIIIGVVFYNFAYNGFFSGLCHKIIMVNNDDDDDDDDDHDDV